MRRDRLWGVNSLQTGNVLGAQFSAARLRGHEQVGSRPTTVVRLPDPVGTPRLPDLIVVPCTTIDGTFEAASPALYPHSAAGTSGFTADRIALTHSVRILGISPIRAALHLMTQLVSPGVNASWPVFP